MGYTRSRNCFFNFVSLGGGTADGLGKYVVAELFLQDITYLSCAVADCIQAYDTVCQDFLTLADNLRINVQLQSRGVFMVTSPIEVCICLLIYPLQRLPNSHSLLFWWLSISFPGHFSNSGTNTPSLPPDRSTPAFNFSMAYVLNFSKTNDLFINKECL